MSVKPYPLQCQPVFQERVWGGRNLERFGFDLPEGRIGEAWMIGDHPNGTTRVANGEWAGRGLDDIRRECGKEWFGVKGLSAKTGRFPLLIKLLDCQDDLSVQVHPSDDYEGLPEGELGKTEMWYVLDAKPGARIIIGLKDGVTREDLAEAVEKDRVMDCLQEVSVSPGDAFYIPAGTVHALCSGVLVAEIQQNSDTTYRLYDYGRLGLDGKPRQLHVKESLDVIDFVSPRPGKINTSLPGTGQWLTIASSPYFQVEKGQVAGRWEMRTRGDSFTIFIVTDGTGNLLWEHGSLQAKPGDCFLIPANLETWSWKGDMTLLRSYVP